MKIEKYSIGIGDRFEHQGAAQLAAFVEARKHGVDVVPVWNKSNREHSIIGTKPESTRREADAAVKKLGWEKPYYVDADHIGINTVDLFIDSSNYFTLDVADFLGGEPGAQAIAEFTRGTEKYIGKLRIPGLSETFDVSKETISAVGQKYLAAVQEAGKIYRHILSRKGKDNFITEVSTDEASSPQTPVELFFVLAALSKEGVPVQTIAPRFIGQFLKGVDYIGDKILFQKNFEQDVAVISFAAKEFSLPENLKISVHTGSDKFSIYPIIYKTIKKLNAGLHLKTAGTTWLEEVIGLAKSDDNGLKIAKEIYIQSYERYDEFSKPYLTVIDIDKDKLPSPATVRKWSATDFVGALNHDQKCSLYNPSLRQLFHIGYKVAAEMGKRFTDELVRSEKKIGEGVTNNLYDRHLRPIFLG
jgi:tagaturonate epimerase